MDPNSGIDDHFEYWFNNKEYNLIERYIFLGSETPVKDGDLMCRLNIRHVLSVTENQIPFADRFEGIDYKHIEAGDFPDQDLLSEFDNSFKILINAQNKEENVYIHCGSGVSRSATIVIAFFMKKYSIKLSDAISIVYIHRKVFPNEGFLGQLELYEKMNFKIDANYYSYRQFMLKSLTYKLRTGSAKNTVTVMIMDNMEIELSITYEQYCVRKYFDKILIAEQLSNNLKKGRSYHCLVCNTELFNEINVIKDYDINDKLMCLTNNKFIGYVCDNFFIEPLQTYCTQPDTDKTGYLKCPNCLQAFGIYNWLLFNCNCIRHKSSRECLALKVFRNKVS